jgi:putative endonuclease
MATHIDLGKQGETLAAAWLKEKGFQVIQRNWRYGQTEIDIIAIKEGMLHFIEVKCRSGTKVFPEANVTNQKIRTLLRAISQYLLIHPQYRDFRLDILSVLVRGNEAEYFFIEDVYLYK